MNGRNIIQVLCVVALMATMQVLLARTGAPALAATCLLCLGAGVALTAAGGVRRAGASVRDLAALAALEALHSALLVAALRSGDTVTVIALHLTAPIILLAAVARGRLAGPQKAAAALATATVVLAAQATPQAGGPASDPQLGAALAALAACSLAALMWKSGRVMRRGADARQTAAVQMLGAAALLAPAAAAAPPSLSAAGNVLALGALLCAPSMLMLYRIFRVVDPAAAGVLFLCEPVFGAAVAFALFGDVPSITAAFAALCAVAAARVQQRAPETA